MAIKLADRGVFCVRHGATLPSPSSFTVAHSLAGHLLSIPCDQRMSVEDADFVGAIVRDSLTGENSVRIR